MNTEITDDCVTRPAGWIFFDAECPFCAASRRRWGPLFERRRFVWVPLQTPGTAERLGVAPKLLMTGMWLLPAGSPPLSGADAWLRLMRHVWWLAPPAALLALPGLRTLARAVYGWVARHRHCLGGQCRLPHRRRRRSRRRIPFLEFP